MKLPHLSKVEWDLMNEVWRLGGATVADIHARFLEERGWSHNTVKTMMQRLVKKGYLRRDASRRAHFYQAIPERRQVARSALSDVLDRILEQGFGPLVAYAAERKKLSRREIHQLKEILEKDEGHGT